MIFIAVPLVIGGIILAPKIIDLVYDPSYFPSILAFQILIITAGIIMLSSPFSQALVVSNQQKKAFWIVLFGAIVNVILNLILIPKFSLYGAAFTTLVASFLMLFLSFKFTSKFTEIKPLNLKLISGFSVAMLSAVSMCFVISQSIIYHLHVLLSIVIGIGVYLVCFFVYKSLVGKFLLIFKIKATGL